MKLVKILIISTLFLVGCSSEQGASSNGSEQKTSSTGIEGCSHSFRELPDMVKSTSEKTVMKTFSNIEFAVNYSKVDSVLGLAKEDRKNASLQVVGTLYTKDGVAVERAGNIIYYFKDGIYSSTQNWLPEAVNKEEFVETFGAYPKVSCRIVGM